MCKYCPYWFDDETMKPRCNFDKDAGKYGKSACDAEFEQERLSRKKPEKKTA